MGLSRNPSGPLRNAILSRLDEVIFFSPTIPPDIDPEDSDISYIVKIGDRLDLLAARTLRDAQLGWVILHRNDLRLAPNDLVPGRTIYIPTIESLQRRGIV